MPKFVIEDECGCYVDDEAGLIVRCPLHAQAPAMLAALRTLLDAYDHKRMTPVSDYAPMWAETRAILRAVGGGE